MSTEPHKRRWFQFRLRTLLNLVAVLAVPLAWLAHERQKVRERNEWLKTASVRVFYNSGHAQPAWLRALLGDDSPGDVYALNLEGNTLTNAAMVHVAGLTQLETLWLHNTRVTDAGLVQLIGLRKLYALHLNDTQVTEAGCQKLRQSLPNTKIYPEP